MLEDSWSFAFRVVQYEGFKKKKGFVLFTYAQVTFAKMVLNVSGHRCEKSVIH